MAKIVFTWELGGGMGHIAPYVSVVKTLHAKGHVLFFIMRDLGQAHLIRETYRATCFQAPLNIVPEVTPVKTPLTYAHILHNIGFSNPVSLRSTAEGWRALFDIIKPDIVIFDHSPTALLAARGYMFRKVLIGTGFVIPPPVYPLPNLRHWVKADPELLRRDEDLLLASINAFLDRFRLAPLNRVTDLFATEPHILCTLKELDHYQERENGDYYGTWMNPVGETPLWPEGKGKKIFVYLKPFQNLPALIKTLGNLKMPVIVYIARMGHKLQEKLGLPTLRFVNNPQDMTKIAEQCDFAILNGTHSTSINLLLAGKPALHLPLHLEQYLTADHIEALGAGINEPTLKPTEMCSGLELLLKSDSYAEAAIKFACRYKDMRPNEQNEKMIATIENILI
jgi:UDP:flavonoid glycosyltransferase YjiC (YdhE family)